MTGERLTTTDAEEVKTCGTCGGIWPANRPTCPACGAGLAHVAANPPVDAQDTADFDWRWLDALAPEEDEGTKAGDEGAGRRAKGAWWQFWR